jgi:hypothetical protein
VVSKDKREDYKLYTHNLNNKAIRNGLPPQPDAATRLISALDRSLTFDNAQLAKVGRIPSSACDPGRTLV